MFKQIQFLILILLIGSMNWAEEPTGLISAYNAKIVSLNFYESGEQAIPVQQRQYKDRFERVPTRRVNWEMKIEFPKSDSRRSFQIEEYWYDYKDRILKHQFYEALLNPNVTSAMYDHSFGWNLPGNWQNGTYRLELFVDKKKVASKTFEIFEGTKSGISTQNRTPSSSASCDSVVGKWAWFTGGPRHMFLRKEFNKSARLRDNFRKRKRKALCSLKSIALRPLW